MPGGDGRGPAGFGPRTGRGLGYCAGYDSPGFTKPGPGMGGGYRRGFGPGRGLRRGVNYGYRRGGYGFYPYNQTEYTPKDEAEELKNYAQDMKKELEEVMKRIEELESE